MIPRLLTAALLAFSLSCQRSAPPLQLAPLVEEFVHESLAFSPVGATAAGYHRHRGVLLDDKLDDYSPAGIDRQRRFYRDFRQKLAALRSEQLAPAERADHEILAGQIELAEVPGAIRPRLERLIRFADFDRDGLLTRQEFLRGLEQRSRILGRQRSEEMQPAERTRRR